MVRTNKRYTFINDLNSYYGYIMKYYENKNSHAMKMNSVDETGIETMFPDEYFQAKKSYHSSKG